MVQVGFFMGVERTPLLLGGDSVPNLTNPLEDTGLSRIYISQNAVNYIGLGYTQNDFSQYVLMNGQAVTIDGTLVGLGREVPASAGGVDGETWQSFEFLGLDVTDSGEYIITGNTAAPNIRTDDILIKNGAVLYREMQVIDGVTVTGKIEQAVMNEHGDVAYVWYHSGGLIALFVNDQLLISEGDLVDWDNDGAADAGYEFHDTYQTTRPSIQLTNRDAQGNVDIYFLADVTRPGTFNAHGGFRMTVELPLPFCPADLAGGSPSGPDGFVNVSDLFALLANWNTAGPGADLAPPSNVVNVNDLFVLLAAWGPCN